MFLVFGMEAASLTGDIKVKKCETCGQVLSLCRFNGSHPKCKTCGKIVDNCRYNGNHPKCKTCGKTLENCRYDGNHPKCKTCMKILENCPYGGNHPVQSYDVLFTCNASGATLYVDGKKMGPANGHYSIKSGNHDVKLLADGYEPYTATIRVNNATSFNYKMKQTDFDVLISCNVKDATVTVDGNDVTNLSEKIKMKEGHHSVKIVSKGYNDTTAVISVDKDHTTFKFDLIPEQSIASVTTAAGYVKTPSKSSSSPSQPSYITQPIDHSIDWADGLAGCRYTYSKYFPIGFGAVIGGSHFSFGLDFGLNIDKKKIHPSDNETVNPKFYACFNPGFFYKFFSINCGVGSMMHDYEKTTTTSTNENSSGYNGGYSSASTSVSVSETKQEFYKMSLLLNPSIEGRIPICGGERMITLNVGYLFIPKYKELNGLTFGIGFQWTH